MRYLLIDAAVGVFILILLLILFFKGGKKTKKQRLADRQLIQNCGDESLLRLYEQAESDNEREGILEFAKEKLAAHASGGEDAADILPAGALVPNDEPLAEPAPVAEADPEPDIAAVLERAFAQMAAPPPDPAPEPTAISDNQAADNRRQITGLVSAYNEPAEEEVREEAAPASPVYLNTSSTPSPAPVPPIAPAQPIAPSHDGQLQTRELPLDKVDWATLEQELQKKREEEARIMAHNQLIQDVFAKIQGVEDRVVGEKRDDNENH